MNIPNSTLHLLDTIPIVVVAFVLLSILLSPMADAYFNATNYPPSPDDMWNIDSIHQTTGIRRTINHLRDNGWVSGKVDNNDLDYILTLTQHLSTYYPDIDPWLIIAQIAVESRFDKEDLYDGARGLMQLLPYYHEDRLIQFLEEDERYSRDLFYDPRLNIMTGLDYMNDLLKAYDGDETYALMAYNQGPSSAKKTYVLGGIVSKYAKDILKLRDELVSINQ